MATLDEDKPRHRRLFTKRVVTLEDLYVEIFDRCLTKKPKLLEKVAFKDAGYAKYLKEPDPVEQARQEERTAWMTAVHELMQEDAEFKDKLLKRYIDGLFRVCSR